MQRPKYHVGQAVAVCSRDCRVIIPATIVTVIKWLKPGRYYHPITGVFYWQANGIWSYQVAESPIDIKSQIMRFAEESLRPISPDTEYLDQEEREQIA